MIGTITAEIRSVNGEKNSFKRIGEYNGTRAKFTSM
jgi:hypothetical protein